MDDMEERQVLNSERYEKYGRNQSWIVKRYDMEIMEEK
jgi:hypothetical protein